MEGVKILNEISPMTAGIWFSCGIFVLVGIGALILIFSTLDRGERGIPSLICILPFAFAAILFFTKYTSPMKYEAIIDDNVRLSEFEKKYEIVEKRGDIYVIKERESNER